MGRLFASASSQYAELVTTIGFAEPCTLCCWYKATSFATAPFLVNVTTGVTSGIKLGFTNGGAAQIVCTDAASTSAVKNTTTTVSAGAWAHALAVCTTAASRDIYLNAAGLASDTTSITQATLDRYLFGARYSASSRGLFANGVIADAAVWNVALSSQEIAALAAGISPALIRPASLQMYAPFWGEMSPELNLRGTGVTLGAAGAAPTNASDHPRIYQGGRSIGVIS